MGVVYAVILQAVDQYAVQQHRIATTWQDLLKADPTLMGVIDGTYMASRFVPPPAAPALDVLNVAIDLAPPFTGNTFGQVVINPYPFSGYDRSLEGTPAAARPGEHLCFVTNRVAVPVTTPVNNPAPATDFKGLAEQLGTAAFLATEGTVDDMVRFESFRKSQENEPDISKQAAALVDFLAGHYEQGTISALIRHVLRTIVPTGERVAIDLSEVLAWDNKIHSFCLEASFPLADAITYTNRVLEVVAEFAARARPVFIGGYISLRIVGTKTQSLLGMQQWSPTCSLEYMGVAGTRDLTEFVDRLQRIALDMGGILHLGLQNNVMTATDFRRAYGGNAIDAFRRARVILADNGTRTTFDNVFTDRLGLSIAVAEPARDRYLHGLLLAGKFRRENEIDRMLYEEQRNTLITELANRTAHPIATLQSLDNVQLTNAGALLVMLRAARLRDDAMMKTMTIEDMRSVLAVDTATHSGLTIPQLLAAGPIDLVLAALGSRAAFLRGVLLAGGFRTAAELNTMSTDDQRNTLIVELAGRTNHPVPYLQRLGSSDLGGIGALLVFLRVTGIRTDAELKTMSADDMRNTLIVETANQTRLDVGMLQAMSNLTLVATALSDTGN